MRSLYLLVHVLTLFILFCVNVRKVMHMEMLSEFWVGTETDHVRSGRNFERHLGFSFLIGSLILDISERADKPIMTCHQSPALI